MKKENITSTAQIMEECCKIVPRLGDFKTLVMFLENNRESLDNFHFCLHNASTKAFKIGEEKGLEKGSEIAESRQYELVNAMNKIQEISRVVSRYTEYVSDDSYNNSMG